MQITTVAFQEPTGNGQVWWIVAGLNIDIAAQGKSRSEAMIGFRKVVAASIKLSTDLGEEPFANIGPTPTRGLLQFSY